MRLTERGQLTIPKGLRARYGMFPGTEVDALEADNGILIVKKGTVSAFERFRGAANATGLPSSTDELLDLLRDGDDA